MILKSPFKEAKMTFRKLFIDAIFLANIFVLLCSIIGTFMNLKYFTLEDFGTITYIIKASNVIAFISNLGLAFSINQFPKYVMFHRQNILRIIAIVLSLNGVIAIIYFHFFRESNFLIAGIAYSLALLISMNIYSFLNGKQESKNYSILRVMQSLFPLILVATCQIFSVQLESRRFLYIMVIFLSVSSSISLIVSLKRNNKVHEYENEVTPTLKFLKFALHSYPFQLYRGLHLNLDFMILGFILDGKDLAEYSLAITLAVTPQIYLVSQSVSIQSIARRDKKYLTLKKVARNIFVRNFCYSSLILFLEIIFFSLFHESFFKGNISTIFTLLVILVPACLIDATNSFLGSAIIGLDKGKMLSKIQAKGFLLNALLLFIVIGKFGILGAASASLFSYSYVLVKTKMLIKEL